jgi:hypothetical protein
VLAGETPVLVHNSNCPRFATDSNGVTTELVPDPPAQYKPSGALDRTSAVYISVRDANGNITTVGSRPGGIHAEDVAQQTVPGGQ